MKNTKLFSAVICGSLLLASCSFSGTKGTFEEDLKAKYENDAAVKVAHDSALSVTNVTPFASTDSETYTASFEMSDSLASLDGIALLAMEGTDTDAWATFRTYSDPVKIAFDETDAENKTVKVTVTSSTAPKNYVLQLDGTKVKSAAGKMLDTDGDGLWGEADDTYWVLKDATDVFSQYELPSSLTMNGWFNFSISYSRLNEKLTASTDAKNNETEMEKFVKANFKVEYYDSSKDKWTELSGTTDINGSNVVIEVSNVKQGYFRVVSGNLVGKTLSDKGKTRPYTTDNFLKYGRYVSSATYIYNIPTTSPVVYPYSNKFGSHFNVTYNKGYVDLKFDQYKPSSWYSDKNTYCYVSTFLKLSGVSKDSVKVYSAPVKENGNVIASYSEIAVKEAKVINDDTIRVILTDSQKTLTNTDIITVTPAVSAEFEGKKGTEDDSFKVSFGHLCTADSVLTKGGNTIINQN